MVETKLTPFQKGQKLHETLSTLGMHHRDSQICFDSPEHLQGYIDGVGQWNDFDPKLLIPAIEKIDKLIPRKYISEGHGNNGDTMYHWGMKGDEYVFIKTKWLSEKEKITIENILPSIETILEGCDCDVVKYSFDLIEAEYITKKVYELNLYAYWG